MNKSKKRFENFVSKLLKNRCKLASVVATMFLFSVTTSYAAPQYNFVRIVDGDSEVVAYSGETTVNALLEEHGIEISENDVLYPAGNTPVSNGMLVVVDRIKKVNLTCDGYTVSYWTDAETFNDFISLSDIDVSESDIVSIDRNQKLKLENDVVITRVEVFSGSIDEDIPYGTSVVYDGYLADGNSYVQQAGETGTKRINCEIVYHDGVEVSRNVYSEEIVKNPVDEIVCEGVAGRPGVKTINGQIINYSKVITCSATAYDLSFQSTGKYPGQAGYGITASGTYARKGTVAVDPRVIPLGTKMYIESTDGSVVYGLCTAEDTGGAIKGNKVDLFYDTNYECMQFGRRSVNVYILE